MPPHVCRGPWTLRFKMRSPWTCTLGLMEVQSPPWGSAHLPGEPYLSGPGPHFSWICFIDWWIYNPPGLTQIWNSAPSLISITNRWKHVWEWGRLVWGFCRQQRGLQHCSSDIRTRMFLFVKGHRYYNTHDCHLRNPGIFILHYSYCRSWNIIYALLWHDASYLLLDCRISQFLSADT